MIDHALLSSRKEAEPPCTPCAKQVAMYDWGLDEVDHAAACYAINPWVIACYPTGSERCSFVAQTALGKCRDTDGAYSVEDDEDEDEDGDEDEEDDDDDDVRAQGSIFG